LTIYPNLINKENRNCSVEQELEINRSIWISFKIATKISIFCRKISGFNDYYLFSLISALYSK